MDKIPISDVSDTALWVAHYRAIEMERPDALFHDPLAARLAGEKGRKIAVAMRAARYTGWSVVVRTCIIDDYIRELIAEGVDTVVNLGCGLDTRPYRMDLPSSLQWIEVDYPHMIEFKDQCLENETPKCGLRRVKLDLALRPQRQALFHEISTQARKVLVLTEGVAPYLTEVQVSELAEDLRQSKAFSYWIIDYFAPAIARYWKKGAIRKQMRNAPFQFLPQDWFGFFAKHGWTQRSVRYLAEESDRLGRKIPIPLWAQVLGFISYVLTAGKKQEAYKKFSGYVVLEPSPRA